MKKTVSLHRGKCVLGSVEGWKFSASHNVFQSLAFLNSKFLAINMSQSGCVNILQEHQAGHPGTAK